MFIEYAKERRVTPPNHEGLDLVRGENTNSGCVTKAAGIIYASVQEATVKSQVYSKQKDRRRKGSMCFRVGQSAGTPRFRVASHSRALFPASFSRKLRYVRVPYEYGRLTDLSRNP